MGISQLGLRAYPSSNYVSSPFRHRPHSGSRGYSESMTPMINNLDDYDTYCHHHHCYHGYANCQYNRKSTSTHDNSSTGISFNSRPLPLDADPPTEQPTDEDFEMLRREWELPKPSAHRGSKNFLNNLWKWLNENPYNKSDSPLMYWSRCGLHIIIPDEPKLTSQLLVEDWLHKGYSSFARQLNIYGFRRVNVQDVTEGPTSVCPHGSKIWYHPWLGRHCTEETLNRAPRHASSSKKRRSNNITVKINTRSSPYNYHQRSRNNDTNNRRSIDATKPQSTNYRQHNINRVKGYDEMLIYDDFSSCDEEARDPSYGPKRRNTTISSQSRAKRSTIRKKHNQSNASTVNSIEETESTTPPRPSSGFSSTSTASVTDTPNFHNHTQELSQMCVNVPIAITVPPAAAPIAAPVHVSPNSSSSSFHRTTTPALRPSIPSSFQYPVHVPMVPAVNTTPPPTTRGHSNRCDQQRQPEQQIASYDVSNLLPRPFDDTKDTKNYNKINNIGINRNDSNNSSNFINYMTGYYDESFAASVYSTSNFDTATSQPLNHSKSAAATMEYDDLQVPLLLGKNTMINKNTSSSPSSLSLSTPSSVCSPFSSDEDQQPQDKQGQLYPQQTQQQDQPPSQQSPIPHSFPEMKEQPLYFGITNNDCHNLNDMAMHSSIECSIPWLSDENTWPEDITSFAFIG